MSEATAKTTPDQKLRVAEFFAGIGLVRLALDSAGFETIYSNDIDPNKEELYRANFGVKGFHLGDIHEIEADSIPACDLFTASFPCNDLSIAGAMRGLNGNQSGAYWGLIRILEPMV